MEMRLADEKKGQGLIPDELKILVGSGFSLATFINHCICLVTLKLPVVWIPRSALFLSGL